MAAVAGSATAGAHLVWWLAGEPSSRLLDAAPGGLGHLSLSALATGSAGLLAVAGYGWLVVIIATTIIGELVARANPALARLVPVLGPATARRAILAVCGIGLAGGMTSTSAWASSAPDAPSQPVRHAVVGLELPDLPVGGRASGAVPHRPDHVVVVRPGDSLWLIAARLVGDADVGQIAAATTALYTTNRTEVGPDPDLIQPATVLTIPGVLR